MYLLPSTGNTGARTSDSDGVIGGTTSFIILLIIALIVFVIWYRWKKTKKGKLSNLSSLNLFYYRCQKCGIYSKVTIL